ncbi:MAG TPA: DJ-1/PfpI family protein, partial [Candidatus Babeliales bacterium]|nr:DJ-1/PfpI family protein [Candidatus Babeliales bacterium]
KPIGAICIATRILAKAGVLRDKYATGWNEDGLLNAIYAENGVHYLPEEKVIVESNVITATDPSAAQQFGEHIVELLQSKQRWG